MALQRIDLNPVGSPAISRRILLGAALAAGILGPLIGTGSARADSAGGTTGGAIDSRPAEEEYEIPDGIGSTPWW